MTGITNKPEGEEQARQALTQARKEGQAPEEMRGEKDEIVGKNRSDKPEDRGRVGETGAGRGLDHEGH